MPVFHITSPEGHVYEVNAPEGATEQDAIAYVQKQHAAPQQPNPQHYADLQRQAAAMPQQDPTEGNNFLQNAVIGYGKSGVDTARGIGQLVGDLTNGGQSMHGLVTGKNRAQERQAAVDEQRRLDAPLMSTGGGVVGNIVGQVHQMAALPEVRGASLLGKLAPYANAAIHGAAFSGAQGVGTGESRGMNAVVGGALGAGGQAVAAGAGRLATRAAQGLNPEVRTSIELAKAAGIPLHLSQVTDSKALKTVGSALNYLPLSGAAKAGNAQQQAFNVAVGRSFGLPNAPVLSDEVMKGARQKIGDEFNSIYKGKHLAISDAPIRRMAEIEKAAMEDLPDEAANVVRKQFQKVLTKVEDGSITGEQYQALRTSLGNAVDGTRAGSFIKQMRSALDDAAKLALGPQDAARLTKAHGQWANLRTAEKALQQVEGAKGNVKPSSLWGVIRNGSTQEMRALAKIGQNVLKDPIPDSGTAARDLVYRGLGLGGGAAGAASALGVLMPAAKLAAMGVTGARLLNSQTAAKVLGQGRPTTALARLLQGAPRALPLLTPAVAQAKKQP